MLKDATYRAFLYAYNVTNIEITGGGKVDGQGANWWTLTQDELAWERPRLFQFQYATNIKLHNLGNWLKF